MKTVCNTSDKTNGLCKMAPQRKTVNINIYFQISKFKYNTSYILVIQNTSIYDFYSSHSSPQKIHSINPIINKITSFPPEASTAFHSLNCMGRITILTVR